MNRNEIPRIENSNFDNQEVSGEKGSFKRKSPTRFIIFVFLAGILAGIIATLIISLSSRNSARKMPITFSNNNFTLTPKGAIFHQSEPVNPNETVLATGGSWTENSSLLVILTLVDANLKTLLLRYVSISCKNLTELYRAHRNTGPNDY